VIVELAPTREIPITPFARQSTSSAAHALLRRDTWEGDPQSGCYGPEVYADLSVYQDSHYRRFSTLLRMRFDDALARFAPATIDPYT